MTDSYRWKLPSDDMTMTELAKRHTSPAIAAKFNCHIVTVQKRIRELKRKGFFEPDKVRNAARVHER